MSNVHLAIGGRRYTVACTPGEEDHVAALGSMIDANVTASGAIAQNETRMLLFAALMLADELHETREARLQDQRVDAEMEPRLDRIMRRIEALAHDLDEHLEDRVDNT